MLRIKIVGAGSIGNHIAHAARRLGWEVVVCDIDPAALRRMKDEIYPSRYEHWDPAIELYTVESAPVGDFNLIHIGTPPEFHIPLALRSLEEQPAAIVIEKPLCEPTALASARELVEKAKASRTKVFVGYNHVVGKGVRKIAELLKNGMIGEVKTVDVEFREHWAGIFKAHPWLDGPGASYLGFWTRGGGASGEHSHAINLWQHFAQLIKAGRVVDVSAMLTYVEEGKARYDSICSLNLRTEKGFTGRVIQDVVTTPPRKWARIQGTVGALEWSSGLRGHDESVVCLRDGAPNDVHWIEKQRPDDFIEELRHVAGELTHESRTSAISLERGVETMQVIDAAHRSAAERRWIRIDYATGIAHE